MGLSGLFKESAYKEEIYNLKKKNDELLNLINNVGMDKINNVTLLNSTIQELNAQKQRLEEIISTLEQQKEDISTRIKLRQSQLVDLDDEVLVQSFGLYKPKFDFANALVYKEQLDLVRQRQKTLIKEGKAVTGNFSLTYNNSLAKGQKMVRDMQKLLLRAFNNECDDIISKVKYSNYDISLKRLHSSADSISKLASGGLDIAVSPEYRKEKVLELTLAFEYQQKKQQEKEELREARAAEREAAKLQKELDEQRKKIEKEKNHYEKALADINKQLAADPENPDFLEKKSSLEASMVDIEKSLTNIDYREANQRAGYVYIISNIGAFGENVYKIGMTRRLDPQDRIDELGDASVPFNFDVHAMIFSDDAPALEAALHNAFKDKKVNMVNTRREFFNVTLDEIKEVVKNNFDKTVEFIDVANAEQFRVSQKMREELSNSN